MLPMLLSKKPLEISDLRSCKISKQCAIRDNECNHALQNILQLYHQKIATQKLIGFLYEKSNRDRITSIMAQSTLNIENVQILSDASLEINSSQTCQKAPELNHTLNSCLLSLWSWFLSNLSKHCLVPFLAITSGSSVDTPFAFSCEMTFGEKVTL